jgi:hypothetical protein
MDRVKLLLGLNCGFGTGNSSSNSENNYADNTLHYKYNACGM